MIPRVQSRIGENGTCFRASLASVLNLKESRVPDFPECNCDPGVDEFLAPRGLRYEEYPITDPAPRGYHIILGTSWRGGQHAVVGLNGKLVHDPHPAEDDPRRGLVEPKSWGVLEPLCAAGDAVARFTPQKFSSPAVGGWRGMEYRLLADGRLQARVGSSGWQASRLFKDEKELKTWLRDNPRVKPVNTVQDHMTVSPVDGSLRYGDQRGRGFKRWAGRRNGAKDAAPLSRSQLDKYSMRAILDVLGITIQEYMRRTEAQKDRLLSTAIEHLDNVVKAKDAAPLSGKRLNAAAEGLKQKHDEIAASHMARVDATYAERYRGLMQPTSNLVNEAEQLLGKAKLDDDPAYWLSKLKTAKESLHAAKQLAQSNDYGRAVAYLDCAFSLAHAVIDKMRNSGRSRGRDMRKTTPLRNVPLRTPEEQKAFEQRCNELLNAKPVVVNHKPKAQDSSTRRSRLHRALDRVLGTDTLKEEILKENVEKLGMPVGRKAWNEITPHEAAQLVRKSRGMSKEQFNRLWEIARKGHITPF